MTKLYILFFALSFLLVSFFLGRKKIKTPEGFVLIPAQSYVHQSDSVNVGAFFMSNHEVTNAEYRAFLSDFKKVEHNPDLIQAVTPDTLAWTKVDGFTDVFSNLYFWHPAYSSYPVVNVSKKGVELYCQWLTNKLKQNHSNQIGDARIPSEIQWKVAASGGLTGPYPWGGPYVRNAKGQFLANFLTIGDHMITESNDGEFAVVHDSIRIAKKGVERMQYRVTVPSFSFDPNSYGLYNMSGNVAELCAENKALGGHWKSSGYDIRIESEMPFEEANPFVGFRPIITFLSTK